MERKDKANVFETGRAMSVPALSRKVDNSSDETLENSLLGVASRLGFDSPII